MTRIIDVGLIQMNSRSSAEDNLTRAIIRIENLAKRGAKIVCVPELFLSPYFCQKKDKRFFALAESLPGKTTRILSKIAKREKIVIVASIFEKSSDKRFFNTAVVFDANGKLCGHYRKMHIPDDPKHYYAEAYYFEDGNLGVRSFQTRYGTIAVLVCWDQWFPEMARIAASQGAQILFYPTSIGWPKGDSKKIRLAEYEAWKLIQKSHAVANNIFVVAVNRVGLEENINFWGTSFVSDPYGRIIVKAPSNREANLIARCDLNIISEMRKDWPFLVASRVKLSL